MENMIKQFENKEFGRLEVLMIGDKPYFPAVECAKILGYSKERNAIERHCRYAKVAGSRRHTAGTSKS